jgi:hypothetical protein
VLSGLTPDPLERTQELGNPILSGYQQGEGGSLVELPDALALDPNVNWRTIKLYILIKAQPFISQHDLIVRSGMKSNTVRALVAELADRGYVIVAKSRKVSYSVSEGQLDLLGGTTVQTDRPDGNGPNRPSSNAPNALVGINNDPFGPSSESSGRKGFELAFDFDFELSEEQGQSQEQVQGQRQGLVLSSKTSNAPASDHEHPHARGTVYRKRNECFDIFAEWMGARPGQRVSRAMAGKIVAALREIREIVPGFTPQDLIDELRTWPPDWTKSPLGVAKWWGLEKQRKFQSMAPADRMMRQALEMEG